MREIKFRAWDKETKKMFPVLEIDFVNEWIRMHSEITGQHCNHLDNLVLMQFTGLKDKTSREICEGDIILSPNNELGEISWDYFYASFCVTFNGGFSEELDITLASNSEIVGNIYENKELPNE